MSISAGSLMRPANQHQKIGLLLPSVLQPLATRGGLEPHGLLFFNGLWQRYISSRCVVFLLAFCSAEPSNAESLLYRAYILAPAASASP